MKERERPTHRSRSLDDDIQNWLFTRMLEQMRQGASQQEAMTLVLSMAEDIEEARERVSIMVGRLMLKQGCSFNEAINIMFANYVLSLEQNPMQMSLPKANPHDQMRKRCI